MKSCERRGESFIVAGQAAEAGCPSKGSFDHPAPRLESGLGAFGWGLFAALFDVRTITARPHLRQGRFAFVAGIGTQMLDAWPARPRPRDDDGIEGHGQQFDVMHVGPAGGGRERDPTPVHEQAALAAFFPPDPSDCGPHTPRPAGL